MLLAVLVLFLVLSSVAVFVADLKGGGDEQAARVSSCVERVLAKPATGDRSGDELARYVRRAYCDPFARRGWVYSDGTLKLAAFTESGASQCQEASPGAAGETIPCPPETTLDCALLDLVRRREAQAYVASLARGTHDGVECDDGRSPASLGAE